MPDPITQEINWYKPLRRAVFRLDHSPHLSRSLIKSARNKGFSISLDRDFINVMRGCGDRKETWINNEILDAYFSVHQQGWGHSIEVWLGGDRLVGGVYGISIGRVFFAESMFSRVPDASKIALWSLRELLRERGFLLLEVQFMTKHLQSLGAEEIPDAEYMELLSRALS